MAGLIPFNRRNQGVTNLGNMLDDFFSEAWLPGRNLLNDTFKVDVSETDDGYLIEAELPGTKKEEISLELNDGRLIIAVTKTEAKEDKKTNYIHRERRYEKAQRSVYLADADTDDIKAKLEDGILKIDVSKLKSKTSAKQIDIS